VSIGGAVAGVVATRGHHTPLPAVVLLKSHKVHQAQTVVGVASTTTTSSGRAVPPKVAPTTTQAPMVTVPVTAPETTQAQVPTTTIAAQTVTTTTVLYVPPCPPNVETEGGATPQPGEVGRHTAGRALVSL